MILSEGSKSWSLFWEKVDAEGPCWEWVAGKDKDGYGKVRIAYKHLRPHRVAYETLIGPIPPGHVIDHLCKNPACVCPEHMETCTPAENTRRGGRNATRTHCTRGHEYDEANTYWSVRKAGLGRKGGYERSCRTCEKARQRASL